MSLPVILFRPYVDNNAGLPSYPPSANHRMQEWIDSWLRVFPDAKEDAGVDLEDWCENAVRLHEALQVAPDRIGILPPVGDEAYFLDETLVPEGATALFLGSWNKKDAGAGVQKRYVLPGAKEAGNIADQYAHLQSFVAHAGREIHLCGINSDTHQVKNNLWQILVDMAERGVAEAFVKVNRAKYGITRFLLPQGLAAEEMNTYVAQNAEDLPWSMVHLEGDEDAAIAQEAVKMEHEYRIVVVDHKAVAGGWLYRVFHATEQSGRSMGRANRDRA